MTLMTEARLGESTVEREMTLLTEARLGESTVEREMTLLTEARLGKSTVLGGEGLDLDLDLDSQAAHTGMSRAHQNGTTSGRKFKSCYRKSKPCSTSHGISYLFV